MELGLTDKGREYRQSISEKFPNNEASATEESDFIILNHFEHGGDMSILEEGNAKSQNWFKSVVRRLFEAGHLEEA